MLHEQGRWNRTRVCNSDDQDVIGTDTSASASGTNKCIQPSVPTPEIRIWGGTWEAINMQAWLLQIILSELVGVPTSIETGSQDRNFNFYSSTNRFEYGDDTQVIPSVQVAYKLEGDCSRANDNATSEAYQACAHVVPEIWNDLVSIKEGKALLDNGLVEPPQANGIKGKEGWFITKHTVQDDPTLVSYFGLQGLDHDNRRRLAQIFKRPTTWQFYCTHISNNHCTNTSDTVAVRAPQDETEYDRMFVPGLYTGYFRPNEGCDNDIPIINNATNNNTTGMDLSNCTGHIADYPCLWTSSIAAQTHWLQIPLQSKGDEPGSRGYTYTQLQEIWRAANATRSNLIMHWWSPHALMQEFVGTDAEFQNVLLPTPTQECIEARHNDNIQRCSNNLTDRIGSPAAACDEQARSLLKVISTTVYNHLSNKNHPDLPPALASPAHDVLDRFTLSTEKVHQIFQYWRQEASLRQGVCRWAADNLDYLERFVTPTYPRVLVEGGNNNNTGLYYAALTLAIVAVVLSLVTAWQVHVRRHERAILYSQREFLYLLLSGLLLVSIGAILDAVPPTNGTCLASVWLVNLGMALQLVPHIIKIAAINTLTKAARRLRRVVLKQEALFKAVAAMCGLVVVFLILWTVLIPPQKVAQYELTSDLADDGFSTIVNVVYFCESSKDVFQYIAICGTLLLLLWASVLAVQNRNVRQDFNESQVLSILVYSHLIFTILRLVTFLVPRGTDALSGDTLDKVRSIIFSTDTIATIIIYFPSKLFASSIFASQENVNSRASSEFLRSSTGFQRRQSTFFARTDHGAEGRHESCNTNDPTSSAQRCECPNCGYVGEMRPLVITSQAEVSTVAPFVDSVASASAAARNLAMPSSQQSLPSVSFRNAEPESAMESVDEENAETNDAKKCEPEIADESKCKAEETQA
ncbi:expressed unknown protein [Seminavis robusta]|uniref:G-protein coupled receptors family 3 profile domain-containing protein n=1 Tax=Seminavis robusta TaxID=568900 RepID=A0A9N8H6N3_9STRA|nr:expressed unknown protein [Seminavis robusta]|eukprot:Sro48_g028180.1 n/a (920) ;mRNA; f:51708-54701